MTSLSAMEADSETLDRLAENERHFHTIQAGVRGLASTWTLTAFASLAIVLKHEKDVTWLFPPFALIVLICLMVNVGLYLLWIIDQMIYQRLFNANYIVGLRLEQQFSFIPPVRAIQRLSAGEMSIASWIKFFYIGPISVFAATALFTAGASIFFPNRSVNLLGITMVMVALLSLIPFELVVYYAHQVDFRQFVTLIPGDYSSILTKENCRAIVDRHVERLKGTNVTV